MDTKNATINQRQNKFLPLVTAGESPGPLRYISRWQVYCRDADSSGTVEGCRGISTNSRTRVHTPYEQEMKRVKHYNKFAVEDGKQRTIQERVVNRILAFNTTNSTTYGKLI